MAGEPGASTRSSRGCGWPISPIRRSAVTLADVPTSVWDDVARPGIDAVWLMGVWERSPARRAASPRRMRRCAARPSGDCPASSTRTSSGPRTASAATRSTSTSAATTGSQSLEASWPARGTTRARLRPEPRRPGPRVDAHPSRVLRAPARRTNSRDDPASFIDVDGRRAGVRARPVLPGVARGGAARRVELRCSPSRRDRSWCSAIAEVCDGVRCDMAMLMLDDVSARTWGERSAAPTTAGRLLADDDRTGKVDAPGLRVLGRGVLGSRTGARRAGFDACYDKRLYDRMMHREPAASITPISAPTSAPAAHAALRREP